MAIMDNCEKIAVHRRTALPRKQSYRGENESGRSGEFDDEICGFVFGDEVSAGAQRRETHSCT